MIPVSYFVPSEHSSPRVARAFATGCRGITSGAVKFKEGCDVAIFGSPARWSQIQRVLAEERLWYIDHGYFGRGQYFRVTRNRYQHDGRGGAGQERFAAFGRPVRRWRKDGSHVLVCPQSDEYFQLFGVSARAWIDSVTQTLQKHTDREIRVRWKRDERPIAVDLADAWAVVAFSSSAALDALIAGVPVFVLAPFAAAYRMGTPDLSRIESPVYPEDRESFLCVLAANQWTLNEMSSGLAWRALTEAHAAC